MRRKDDRDGVANLVPGREHSRHRPLTKRLNQSRMIVPVLNEVDFQTWMNLRDGVQQVLAVKADADSGICGARGTTTARSTPASLR